MQAIRRQPTRRPGAALVEMAFVMGIFLLFLFGVIEYCRLLFIRQLVQNAAREGARFAVVNGSDTNLVADTQAQILQRMGGMNTSVSGFNSQVYLADSSGNNIGSASNAQFGQYIAVQVDCDYVTLLPSFLFLNNTIHIRGKALVYSEAN
jgi:Flp pilus assembly protein TadG